MDCPTCNNEDIRVFGVGCDITYQCESCGCTFLRDGEVLEKWQYCVECGNYVAPEDKRRDDMPCCIEHVSQYI